MINRVLEKFGFYMIPPLRKVFIWKNFFEFSFGKENEDYTPNKDLFNRLKHPAELFYLANIYNWDDGPLPLKWIVESHLCSEGTAKLIFWRAAPDFYLKYSFSDHSSLNEHDSGVLNVLEIIMTRFKKGTYNQYEIEFDPSPEIEEIVTKEPKWEVPSIVYQKVHGANII